MQCSVQIHTVFYSLLFRIFKSTSTVHCPKKVLKPSLYQMEWMQNGTHSISGTKPDIYRYIHTEPKIIRISALKPSFSRLEQMQSYTSMSGLFSYTVSGLETRQIPLHLFQSWQARFLCWYSNNFWDSALHPLHAPFLENA